jgi:CYTH domain-containing protein
MATNDREIERKYLLRTLPDSVASARSVEVDQGYIPGERIQERIRRMRDERDGSVRFYRTLKTGTGLERIEIEEECAEAFFTAAWPLTRGARVHKRRYYVPVADGVWEIDEFLDRPNFFLAEFEMERVDQRVEIPVWLAPVLEREVTEERGYTNRALAK